MKKHYLIWLSFCVVLDSMWGKHFQYLHILVVNHYIETTTMSRIQRNLSRAYFLHTGTQQEFDNNLFSCFQLDDMYLDFNFQWFKFWYHAIRSKINYIIIILTEIQWCNIIGYWRNDLLFMNEYIIIVHNKTIVKTVDMKIIFD